MRTLFIFFSLLGAGVSFTQTSVYHSFPVSDAVWHGHLHTGSSDTHFQYGIIGDTTLNGLSWQKVYREENCLQAPDITTANSTLVGAIREDNSKRIYFYSIAHAWAETDSTYLLYDFSLDAGDTIHYTASPTFPYTWLMVDGVDSVLSAGEYRKRFYLIGDGQPETWIEGIGSLRDLLSALEPYPTCSCLLELFCFREEETTYYLKAPYLDCYDLDMGLTENDEAPGKLFPNPSSSGATISPGIPAEEAVLQIFDAQGKTVRQADHLSGATIQLSLDGLQPGLYTVRLMQQNALLLDEKLLISP